MSEQDYRSALIQIYALCGSDTIHPAIQLDAIEDIAGAALGPEYMATCPHEGGPGGTQ